MNWENKKTVGMIVLVLLLVMANGYLLWELKGLRQSAATSAPVVNVGTDGKVSGSKEPQVVYIQGQSTHTKEIVYAPKTAGEPTDVEVNRSRGFVYVKVNGVLHQIPVDVKEGATFEKGKLVITEESTVKLNITAPKPLLNLGVGWSVHGPAAQINGPLAKNVSWWVYGDPKTLAGGLQMPLLR